MTWHSTDDVERWLEATADLLLPEPGVHTISLTVAANCRVRPDGSRFHWWTEPDGSVSGAASQTPPYPPVLAVVPAHTVGSLVDLLSPSGVNGPTDVAVELAALAAKRQSLHARVGYAQRLFRLGGLLLPDVPGKPRQADSSDEDLCVAWSEAFVAETGVVAAPLRPAVQDRLSHGGYTLWEADGEVVALAGRGREAFGGCRIGPVYTPPEHRGRGYGGAVTGEASRLALETAREVVLFTDLTNPTSNALYPRLGYRPVMDRAVLTIG